MMKIVSYSFPMVNNSLLLNFYNKTHSMKIFLNVLSIYSHKDLQSCETLLKTYVPKISPEAAFVVK